MAENAEAEERQGGAQLQIHLICSYLQAKSTWGFA